MSRTTLVRDVMRPPVLAPEGMWFREMVRLLRQHGAELLTIVDAQGWAVGAVTEEDLLLKVARGWLEERPAQTESSARSAERRKASAVTARELMSEPLVSVLGSLEAAEAARLMRERDVRHLVVLDREGRPVGIVDTAGLLSMLLRPDEAIRQDVEDLLARELRGRADSVGVKVRDCVVVLKRRRDIDFPLEDLFPDVLEVEGVLAARVPEDTVADRWRCPS